MTLLAIGATATFFRACTRGRAVRPLLRRAPCLGEVPSVARRLGVPMTCGKPVPTVRTTKRQRRLDVHKITLPTIVLDRDRALASLPVHRVLDSSSARSLLGHGGGNGIVAEPAPAALGTT